MDLRLGTGTVSKIISEWKAAHLGAERFARNGSEIFLPLMRFHLRWGYNRKREIIRRELFAAI